MTTAIVEKLVLELDQAVYKAFEAFARHVAAVVQGMPDRGEGAPVQQASGDLVEIYHQAAAVKPHFEEVTPLPRYPSPQRRRRVLYCYSLHSMCISM